jgi:hypothetical protein
MRLDVRYRYMGASDGRAAWVKNNPGYTSGRILTGDLQAAKDSQGGGQYEIQNSTFKRIQRNPPD